MKLLCTLAAASLLLTAYAGPPPVRKDIVKSTHAVRGQFVGFEEGDYLHAIVKDSRGREASYFLGQAGLEFYLATHARKPGTFTIQHVSSYIPEAGGRQEIDRISGAKIGVQSSAPWWRAQAKRLTPEQIQKRYGPMVEKLTRKPG